MFSVLSGQGFSGARRQQCSDGRRNNKIPHYSNCKCSIRRVSAITGQLRDRDAAHVVLKDTERCPAGHDPRKTWSTKWTGSILDVRLSAAQPTEESWSGDVVSNPSAETEDLFVAQHPETSYRPFDYLGWLRGGGKDRELMGQTHV